MIAKNIYPLQGIVVFHSAPDVQSRYDGQEAKIKDYIEHDMDIAYLIEFEDGKVMSVGHFEVSIAPSE